MLKLFGTSDIKKQVRDYFERRRDMAGKVVVDIPAGKGYTSGVLKKLGAQVRPYDLFVNFFKVDGMECLEADLSDRLPIESESADIVVCQEGIEHLPDQLSALREFNRILKDKGALIITAPSISHLRARMSNLLTESDLYKRMPPNELDAVWHSEKGKMYFGHIFLIGIQRLRVLAVSSGFRIKKIHACKVSISSLLLGFLYPLILIANLYAYFRNVRLEDGIDTETKKKVYGEILWLNIHPTILFGRHLFVEFEKMKVDIYVNRKNLTTSSSPGVVYKPLGSFQQS